MVIMFLLGTLAVSGLIFAIRQNRSLIRSVRLSSHAAHTVRKVKSGIADGYITKAITVFIVVAHISELSKAVSDVSVINMLATAGLFVIWIAAKSGTTNEV